MIIETVGGGEGEWADAVDLGFIFEGFNSQQIGNFHKTTCRLERAFLLGHLKSWKGKVNFNNLRGIEGKSFRDIYINRSSKKGENPKCPFPFHFPCVLETFDIDAETKPFRWELKGRKVVALPQK